MSLSHGNATMEEEGSCRALRSVPVSLWMLDQSSGRPGAWLVLRQLLLMATVVVGKGVRYVPMARMPLTVVSSTDQRGEL